MNYNKVQLAGNLTRDPELRYTPAGTAVAKLGIAVNRKWTGKDGNRQEETTFVDVDCFGKTAEIIGQYLKKGRPIFIDGRLKLDQWDDKTTGKLRQRLGVVCESFQFIDSGGGQDAPQGKRDAYKDRSDVGEHTPANDELPTDSDVPF